MPSSRSRVDRLPRRAEIGQRAGRAPKRRIRHMRRARHVERRAQRRRHRPVRGDIVEPAQHQRAFAFGPRHHLQRHFGHDRERAPRSRQQLAEIVAGDVLHHPPAGLETVAEAGHRMRARADGRARRRP